MNENRNPPAPEAAPLSDRVLMVFLGGGAGWAIWALIDHWADPAIPPTLYLATLVLVGVGAPVALALAGPVSPLRALGGGGLLASLVTGLVVWAAGRYAVATDILQAPLELTMVGLLVILATPFLSAGLRDPGRWRDYPVLFDDAWSILLRQGLGWAFVGLMLVLAFLFGALLDLVGIDLVERLFETGWALAVFVGASFGLALAEVHELRHRLSPHLMLRLLRLQVPLTLVVVVVFLLALPLRGLSGLFGDLSTGATLMAVTVDAILVISVAIGRDDTHEVGARLMTGATRALALLVLPLAGLAAWSVALRVGQYGWTPDRALAASVAALLAVQAGGYAVAAVWPGDWGGRIRRVNVAVALGAIALATLWLTPLLDVTRIATNSQIARFVEGRADADQLPLWEMRHDWGHAGVEGLTRLRGLQDHPERTALERGLNRLARATSRYDMIGGPDPDAPAGDPMARLLSQLARRPEGRLPAPDALSRVPAFWLEQWADGCARSLPDGRPGCVLVVGRFRPDLPEEGQGLMLYREAGGGVAASFVHLGEGAVNGVSEPRIGRPAGWSDALIVRVLNGDFTLRPWGNALSVGDTLLLPEY